LRKKNITAHGILIRAARTNEALAISLLFYEWLKFGDKHGRMNEIRKAIKAKEILVSIDPKTTKIIGFINAIIRNDPISSGPILHIAAFYLRPKFRSRGIGTRMLKYIIVEAKMRGVVAIEVSTAQRPAYRLYRKLGFRQYRADIGEVLLGLDLKESVHIINRTFSNYPAALFSIL
jgi:ribosomal protein S18 acetylase RimI-like enzyme